MKITFSFSESRSSAQKHDITFFSVQTVLCVFGLFIIYFLCKKICIWMKQRTAFRFRSCVHLTFEKIRFPQKEHKRHKPVLFSCDSKYASCLVFFLFIE